MTANYEKDKEKFVLIGTKINPHSSDLFIVLSGSRHNNLWAFLVNPIVGGVSNGKKYDTSTIAGLDYASVEFNCKVSKHSHSILGHVARWDGHMTLSGVKLPPGTRTQKLPDGSLWMQEDHMKSLVEKEEEEEKDSKKADLESQPLYIHNQNSPDDILSISSG